MGQLAGGMGGGCKREGRFVCMIATTLNFVIMVVPEKLEAHESFEKRDLNKDYHDLLFMQPIERSLDISPSYRLS